MLNSQLIELFSFLRSRIKNVQTKGDIMNKKILLVDDNQMYNVMLSKTLMKQGYDVKSFISPSEGLFHAMSSEYDLILLDLMMPDISGLEFIEQLNTFIKNHRPIWVVSASHNESLIRKSLELGAVHYTFKDSNREVFLGEVYDFLHTQSLNNLEKSSSYVQILKTDEVSDDFLVVSESDTELVLQTNKEYPMNSVIKLNHKLTGRSRFYQVTDNQMMDFGVMVYCKRVEQDNMAA